VINGVKNEMGDTLFKLNLGVYVTDEGINTDSDTDILDFFIDNLLPEPITQERYDSFHSVLLQDQQTWANVLSNNSFDIVVIHIQYLVMALLNSPEYQLM